MSSEDEATEKAASKKTASMTKTVNKKKTANKKKTEPEMAEGEETTITLSSSEDETTKKTASKTAANEEATPKKKTARKPAEVMEATSLPSEDSHEDLEDATITKHAYDKEIGLYTVLVTWKKSKTIGWQFLHDMWVDYPEEVKKYRKEKKLYAKAWQVPSIDNASFVVRILSMNGPTPPSATFCLLFDNRSVEKKVAYANVLSDAPKLLEAYLRDREEATSG